MSNEFAAVAILNGSIKDLTKETIKLQEETKKLREENSGLGKKMLALTGILSALTLIMACPILYNFGIWALQQWWNVWLQ